MKKKNIFLITLALVLFDQIIKIIILKTLAVSGNTVNILNLIQITYLENSGSAFGLLSGGIILIGVDIVIIFIILKILLSKKYDFTDVVKIGFSLILSGGMGNFIDRVARGHVVDYIDITKIANYPVFNFADICVVVGVILIVVNILIETVKNQENSNNEKA